MKTGPHKEILNKNEVKVPGLPATSGNPVLNRTNDDPQGQPVLQRHWRKSAKEQRAKRVTYYEATALLDDWTRREGWQLAFS